MEITGIYFAPGPEIQFKEDIPKILKPISEALARNNKESQIIIVYSLNINI